jgi:hypothetical protein
VGPDHSLKFDVPKDVILQARNQRCDAREELFAMKATG